MGCARTVVGWVGRGAVRAARGFSLLELMLVLAIIGILMTVAAVNVLGAGDRARTTSTKASLETIKTQLNTYYLNTSSFPPNLQTMVTAKYLESGKLMDGWNVAFIYAPNPGNTERPYDLGSCGPDKLPGTADDIDVWTMSAQPAAAN